MNVAVAWGIAIWAEPAAPVGTMPTILSTEAAGEVWERLSPPSVPAPTSLVGREYQRWGERYVDAFELRVAVPWFDLAVVGERRVGFPAVSLQYIYVRGDAEMVPREPELLEPS